MTRKLTAVRIDGLGTRYRVVITDTPTPATGNQQVAFLKKLAGEAADTGMLSCGTRYFEDLRIRHDGVSWIAEAEALEPLTSLHE